MKKMILAVLLIILISISNCAFGASSDTKDDNLGNRFGYTLSLRDSDRSNWLKFVVGSDLTADRILTFTPGDADRTITFSGNPTLADWFNQSVKTTASPSFAGLTVNSFAITVSGAPTLNDWFNQSVKTTVSPTFTGITFYQDASHYMTIDDDTLYVRAGSFNLNANYISTPAGYGFLGLGVTADAATSLWVGNTTIGAEQVSGYFGTTFSASGDPTAVYGIWIAPILNTSSTYTSTAVGLKISDFSVASPPAVSYLHGIQIANLTAGELGNYQITLGDASGFYESSYTAGTQTGDLRFILPVTKGTSGQALITDGATPTTTLSFSSMTHSLLSATHTDSTAAGVVRGDIITGQGATPKWARLAKGTRSYQLRMGENEPQWTKSVINAMDYGAVGDANTSCVGTDDTAAINAALAAAPIGSKVFLPRGWYKITDPITFADKALIGEGIGTVICGTGLSASEDAIYVNATSDYSYRVEIKDLSIYMNGGGRDGIRFVSGDYPTLENILIVKPGQDGVHCESTALGQWMENLYFKSVLVTDPTRYGFSFIIGNYNGAFINVGTFINIETRYVGDAAYAVYFGKKTAATGTSLNTFTFIGSEFSSVRGSDLSRNLVYYDVASGQTITEMQFIQCTLEEQGVPQTATVFGGATANTVLYLTVENCIPYQYSSWFSSVFKFAKENYGGMETWYGASAAPVMKIDANADSTNPFQFMTGGSLTRLTLGTNVATFLATPSSANLASAVTGETGSGGLVFADTPTLITPNIGAATGTSLTLTGYVAVDNSSYAGIIALLNPAAYETFIQSNTHIYLNSTDANGVLIFGNGGELGSGTGGTGYTQRFQLSATGVPTSAGLTGSGNGFLCVNSTGVFYRSATVCVAP